MSIIYTSYSLHKSIDNIHNMSMYQLCINSKYLFVLTVNNLLYNIEYIIVIGHRPV